MEMGRIDPELPNAIEAVARVWVRTRAGDPLSLSAAGTLGSLERFGPQTVSALAAREQVSQPAMTQLVGRLEQAGYVVRGPLAGDRRVVLVSLTAAGRETVAARRRARAERVGELFERLDAGDRRVLAAAAPALARLAAAAEEAR